MNRLFIFLFVSQLTILFAKGDEGTTSGGRKVICYYGGVISKYFPSLAPENIDPTLCTHLIYTNAQVDNETDHLVPFNSTMALYDGGGQGYYNRTTKLKEVNPGLKILLHVFGPSYFSKKPTDTFISTFVESAVEFLASYGIDGLHFDWIDFEEKAWPMSEFLRELHKEFEKHGYLIGAYIPGHYTVPYNDEDLDVMKSTCDFLITKTFEYIEGRPNNTFIYSPLDSVKSTMDMYLEKIPANKLVVSIITFSLPLLLKNASENGLGAEVIVDYDEVDLPKKIAVHYSKILQYVNDGSGNWTVHRDEATNSPYLTSIDRLWISYEDLITVRMKAEYAVEKGLGGAAVMTLDLDDFEGTGGEGRFPLTRTLKEVLLGDNNV